MKKNNKHMSSDDNMNEITDIRRELRRRDFKRKKNTGLVMFFIIFAILISSAAYIYIEKYMPNFSHVHLYKYYDELDENVIYIVVGDERIAVDSHPIKREGEIYIPVSFIKDYIDPYIFWDNKADRITITTENKVIRMETDDLNYFINNDSFMLSLPIYDLDGEAYMPAKLLMEFYPVAVEYSDVYNMAVIDYTSTTRHTSEVNVKKAELRYEANIKSPIQESLVNGTELYTFEQSDEFTKVRTSDGLIGFVLTSDISEPEIILPVQDESKMVSEPHFDEKINLVWDQVTVVEANSNDNRRIVHDGLDVLSPTWFSFDRDKLNGEIINIADKDYVDWAHEQGYQVWALITDNFDYVVSNVILSNTDIREYVIKQLLSFAAVYELDGINIDFEMVREEDAVYYIQFLRELAPFMREQGIILSVDMYVPAAHNMYYNRTEVGKAVDYVIIMAYDEHWATSPVSGPVASIGFVENGITDTLLEVPKEKILMGMPYYVRIWTEVPSESGIEPVVTSSAYSMEYAYNYFIEKGAEFIWDSELGCYYSEFDEDVNGVTIKKRIWLEEERSISEKLKLAVKYDLAGVAGWKRNLEKEVIWELIKSYIKNE